MVDSIKPTYRTLSTPAKPRRSETQEVETHSDEKTYTDADWNGVERRSGGDRRDDQQNEDRAIYNMRQSRGRRRGDQPKISTKA